MNERLLPPVHGAPTCHIFGPPPATPHDPEACPECMAWVEKGWARAPEHAAMMERAEARRNLAEAVALTLVIAMWGVLIGRAVGLWAAGAWAP